ncbi:MAG: manganese catalase family protein [Acetobacter sp.]|nr:manganese catalase family protein [Bacteroides sp.]MCM1341647.1 manganese catalase family protein [Acetobacter sp.]
MFSTGVEELGHLEMIATMVHQLTKNLTEKQIEENSAFAAYFVDHTTGVYPTAASGFPWSAASMEVKGDTIADLNEDLAAEQKARVTYDNILRLVDDPDIIEPIRFLREREIVHYQRFGDTLPQSCKPNTTDNSKSVEHTYMLNAFLNHLFNSKMSLSIIHLSIATLILAKCSYLSNFLKYAIQII